MEFPSKALKVTTYNVEWYFENNYCVPFIEVRDFETKTKQLAEIIANEQSHIVCLQEVSGKIVLEALTNSLKANYQLNYRFFSGLYSSKRTMQRVGLLILEDENINILECDSFSYQKSLASILSFIKKSSAREQIARMNQELCLKNIYIILNYHNQKLLILNFHLKANFDPESTAIRELEAVIVQGLIHHLISIQPKNEPFDAILIMGDFNDFDRSFENAFQPDCESTVLERIKLSNDIISEEEETYQKKIIFQNILELIEPRESRVSSIYRILIDHILVFIIDEKKNVIEIVNCKIQHRRKDIDFNRVSDHWPVSATLLFK